MSETLLTTHPAIAAEAFGWDPTTVTAGSGKKLKWKCSAGHSWEAVVGNRTKRNDQCPICSGKVVLAGFNDLSTTHPALADEAFEWNPTTLSFGSGKKVSWKCKRNHIWEATVLARSSGSGCPYCSGRYVIVGENDLETTHPNLAKEVDGWDPKSVIAGSQKSMKWICASGHRWETKVQLRAVRGFGCPYCSGSKAILGETDLATTHPDLAKEAVGWDPSQFKAGSEKKVLWKCSFGHEWEAIIANRGRLGAGCPVCAGQKVQIGFNDIATTNPEIAKDAFGWDPTSYSIGSGIKLTWKCSNGHTYECPPHRRARGDGCPYCSNHVLLVGFNDLMTTHPEIAREASGWDPSSVVAGINEKRRWKCNLGHEWDAMVPSRTRQATGCPVCSNREVVPGFNDLATTHPSVALEADGWDPTTIVAGNHGDLNWKCRLGHEWKALVTNRTSRLDSCPVCSGKQVLKGFNDLATIHPDIAIQADGWDPSTVTAGASSKRFKWVCEQGHKWTTGVANRQLAGCPTCAPTGFAPAENGWLYLMEHEKWGLLQIGITNNPDNRVGTHSSRGWELLDLRGPMDGVLTAELETDLLRLLRTLGAQVGKVDEYGKFDGYTESWVKSSYPVTKLIELINKIV